MPNKKQEKSMPMYTVQRGEVSHCKIKYKREKRGIKTGLQKNDEHTKRKSTGILS